MGDPGPVDVPLAPAQRRLWLLDQLFPGRLDYTVVDRWCLVGALDVPALAAAIEDLTDRHEALRSTFHLERGRPVQRIHPTGAVVLDVRAATFDDATAGERLSAIARTPFTLSSAPLVRWTLLRTAPDRHLLQLVAHHLVLDGWSTEILAADLSACHAARLRGAPREPVAVATSYRDHATRPADPDAMRSQTAYWAEALRDLPAPARLPAPDPGTVPEVLRQSAPLGAALAERIEGVARTAGITPSAVWLACFAAVLGRWGGSPDVVVGSPLSGRTSADLLGTVGFFVATVALRLRVPAGVTGRELIAAAHRVLIDAQLNQDVPFDDVIAAIRPERRADAQTPFSAWFNVLSYPEHPLRLGGVLGERVPAPVSGSPFGLALYVDQRRPGAPRLDLVHDTGRLDPAHARALLGQLLELAGALTADVTAPLDTVRLAREVPPAPANPVQVRETLAERLRRHPSGATAVVDEDGRWTYGELRAAAAQVAARLVEAGLVPGDLVEVAETRGRRLAAAVLGVWDSGGVFLLADPAHPTGWRNRLRHKARPRFVLDWTGDEADLVEWDPHAVPPARRVELADRLDPGPPRYLLPTSGTTREPQLVLGGEKPLLAFLDWWSRRYRLGPHDRFCVLSGLSHDPLLRDLLLPLWNGATLTIPPPRHRLDAARAADWLAAGRFTVLHVTPLLGRLIAAGTRLDHVRLVCFGGDVLTTDTVSAWRSTAPGARLVSVYGTTETPQAASLVEVPPGGPPVEPQLGSGAVEARLAVLTPAGGPAAPGEVGEIVVRSPLLTMGYLDDAVATASAYRRDPWGDPRQAVFHTGDVGRLRWDGSVSFLGRHADLANPRGHRVSLRMVTAELRAVRGVADAVVFERDDRLIAYVVPEPAVAPGSSGVLDELAMAVPAAALPDEVRVVDTLPLTPNGKLDRDRLPQPSEQPDRTVRPAGADERTIAAVWQEVLDISTVGLDDNFFDIGGTSATAVRLCHRLAERLDRAIPPLLVFQSSTVRRMARSLSGDTVENPTEIAATGVTRDLRRAARAGVGSRR